MYCIKSCIEGICHLAEKVCGGAEVLGLHVLLIHALVFSTITTLYIRFIPQSVLDQTKALA